MKKVISLALVIAVIAMVAACGRKSDNNTKVTMQSSADSMAYVLGMNIGRNLIATDSLLNIDMVCEGIRDTYAGAEKLNSEEARAAYLKYMNYDVYERVKLFEQQFLEDLRKHDRKFVATYSGLTYKIHELGDLKKTIRTNRDTVLIRYRALNQAGEIVDTTYLNCDTARLAVGDLTRGIIEAAKLIGEGGHMEAWLPSNLAFGSAGCDSLNVKPNTMLYYELWLIDVEKR